MPLLPNHLGLGGITLQRDDVANAKRLVKAILADGYAMIDSAKGYSISEEWIGESLIGLRDQAFLASKSMARDYQGMKKDIEDSLKKFKTDYLDLYQFHNISTKQEYETVMGENGAYQALLEAQAAGKIKMLGITSHSIDLMSALIKGDFPFASLMIPYNMIEQEAEELLKEAKTKGIMTIAMKPLSGGAIDDWHLALRFFNANELVDVVLVGMGNEEEYYGCREALKEAYSEADKITAEEVKSAIGSTFCRRCGYCQPCPQNINISFMWLLDLYRRRYDLHDWTASRYQSQSANAKDCIACGICETRCPYHLPIVDKMQEIAQSFSE